jgi:hypothetical protein
MTNRIKAVQKHLIVLGHSLGATHHAGTFIARNFNVLTA